MNLSTFWGGGGAAPYEIEQSLRFDGSSDLTRTPGSAGNRRTWTMSMWVKYADDTTNRQGFFGLATGLNDNRYVQWFIHNNNLKFAAYSSTYRRSDAAYRDHSGWYHLVLRSDTTQSSEPDRLRIYVNGELITARNPSQTTTDVPQNHEWGVNFTDKHYIGASEAFYYFKGYIAEFHLVDGSSLAPTSFGEFDDNNVWRPIQASVSSYGTNGVYLKFDPSATNGIGHDHSGNGNHWTATGFTTSGTGTDVMSDTPTTNWCTLNPLDLGEFGAGITVSEGNLRAVSTSSDRHVRSTFFLPTSGKWYWEMTATTVNTAGYLATGLYHSTGSLTSSAIATAQGRWYAGDGYGNGNSWGATYDDGDIIGIAVDMDSGKIWAAKNNTWQASGDPAAGTNPMYSDLLTAYSPDGWSPVCANWQSGNTADFNFGQRAFAYTPPTDFKALNTSNLPAPDIADGSEYFNTVLYTGTGTTNARTDVGFQPDLTWIKIRSAASNHAWYDAIRGSTKVMGSSATDAESTDGSVTPTSTGFTLGSENTSFGSTNGNGYTYVAWNWLAGNGTTTPTQGTIASTASVNQAAGFSIVSYTGTGSTATVGHGLGVAPDMVITKARDGGDHGWGVYHRYGSQGAETQLQLHSTVAPNTGTSFWNGTHPTSTVFTINTSSATNNNGSNMIAYCFAEVEGYSKFGSYTGNGSTDGVFVYTGFRPSFILQKRSSGNAGWNIWDTTRDSYNVAGRYIQPNSSDREFNDTTNYAVDILSNGFKLRSSYFAVNGSGNTFIFAAFAENPFGGSGVSPATAR